MSALIVILAIGSTILAMFYGPDWGAVFATWMVAGIALFIWQAVCDAGKQVTKAFGGEHTNVTQNVYEIVELPESPDPTRPDKMPKEDLPAIITVAKYHRKGN